VGPEIVELSTRTPPFANGVYVADVVDSEDDVTTTPLPLVTLKVSPYSTAVAEPTNNDVSPVMVEST
jgi:hypothetical protein